MPFTPDPLTLAEIRAKHAERAELCDQSPDDDELRLEAEQQRRVVGYIDDIFAAAFPAWSSREPLRFSRL